MKIVFNSSPLIFLARLNFLEIFVNSSNEFYRPEVVNDEIKAKQDEPKEYIQRLIDDNRIEIRGTHLTSLASSLNSRLSKGEGATSRFIDAFEEKCRLLANFQQMECARLVT